MADLALVEAESTQPTTVTGLGPVIDALDMWGEVLKVHGLMNWVGSQAVRVSPRAMMRAMAATLNKP